MNSEDFTPNERNCMRFLLNNAVIEFEDEIYKLSKGIERGLVVDILEAQDQLRSVTYKLKTVRDLQDKLGPFETKAPRIPDLPGGNYVGKSNSEGI